MERIRVSHIVLHPYILHRTSYYFVHGYSSVIPTLGSTHPYRWEGICHSGGRRKSSKGRDCRRTLFSFFSLADPLGHAEGLENMSICVRESEEDWPGREIDF